MEKSALQIARAAYQPKLPKALQLYEGLERYRGRYVHEAVFASVIGGIGSVTPVEKVKITIFLLVELYRAAHHDDIASGLGLFDGPSCIGLCGHSLQCGIVVASG